MLTKDGSDVETLSPLPFGRHVLTTLLFVVCNASQEDLIDDDAGDDEIEHRKLKIVEMLLLKQGTDVNKPNSAVGDSYYCNCTPLHAAASWGLADVMCLLLMHGASVTAVHDGKTAVDQYCEDYNDDELNGQAWFKTITQWSPLRIAAGIRKHKHLAFALREGRMDPDMLSMAEIEDAIATSKATEPAALPWHDPKEGQPPLVICDITAKLVVAATTGWKRTTHWLHHKGVRGAVFSVLVVDNRLVTKDAIPPPPTPPKPRRLTRAAAAEEAARTPLPVLPTELWMYTMGFFLRSWWDPT